MITVAILINGNPLMARSAQKVGEGKYLVDDGSVIQHDPDDGAVALSHKLLDTLVEQGKD